MSIEAIKVLLGPKQFLDKQEDMAPHLSSWRGGYTGKAALVALPTSTEQVSEIVKLCAKANIAVVPQGGNTGLVGGAVPDNSGNSILLNLSKMNRVRALDAVNFTVTAEAGVILESLQNTCADKGFLFPLSMASEGSAEVGGFVSTNAGGTAVLKYGTTRELVLGVEVVLPNGEIWHGLNGLRKNNTGYDLKQLFIGAEGTLGIVTAATLKLFPLPRQVETAFVGVPSIKDAVDVFGLLKKEAGEALGAFECISDAAMRLVLKHVPEARLPLATTAPYYLLIELSSPSEKMSLRESLEAALSDAIERGSATDGVIATSLTHAKSFWHIRETISEAEKKEGKGLHFDISVPISNVSGFITNANAEITKQFPDAIILPFGHIGDGNIHYNLCFRNDTAAAKTFIATKDTLKKTVYAILAQHHGSISAEHGVGVERKQDLLTVKDATSLALMRTLKKAIDPKNLMNPGKMLDA